MKNISEKANISSTAIIHDGVTIEDDVIIHDYVVVYPNTIIKKGAEIYDHCVLGKLPTTPGCVSRKLKEQYKELIIGENTILCTHVSLYTGTNIGNNTLLGDNCSIREECVVGNHCIIGKNVTVNYNTRIGNRVKIMDGTHITGDMVVEDDVFISVNVSTTNDNTMGREEYDEGHVRGPLIRRGATIGAAANILPMVVIGENAIIGAGSVVSRDVPDRKLVLGYPARFIRDVKENELK